MSESSRLKSALHRVWMWNLLPRDHDDVLGRVYMVVAVCRTLVAIHTAAMNVFVVLPQATYPVGVVVATVIMLVWSRFISLWLAKPARRTWGAHLADLGVTVALILTTLLIGPPGIAPLSLAGYWVAAAGVYAAIFLGTRWGLLISLINSVALVASPRFEMQRFDIAFVALVLTGSIGGLVNQLRATIREQEQVRLRSAALAERERLARIVHDGALQVLALVEREGPSLGPRGLRLAALARDSEAQLRALLKDREIADVTITESVDLVASLDKYQSAHVTVSTMASIVMAPRSLVDEVEDALGEILKNVAAHAGPGAHAWILLDQELDDEVILWVRDNGVGMSANEVHRAAEIGRLGIRDSIVGRLASIGGAAILKSAPGAGTEWELRIPIDSDLTDEE